MENSERPPMFEGKESIFRGKDYEEGDIQLHDSVYKVLMDRKGRIYGCIQRVEERGKMIINLIDRKNDKVKSVKVKVDDIQEFGHGNAYGKILTDIVSQTLIG